MVALFQNSGCGLRFYDRTFRSHMDVLILLSLLLATAVLFCLSLRWLTRYFEGISSRN